MMIYFVLSASLLLGIYCSDDLENAINSSTENSLSAEYSDSNSEEILNNPHDNQEDIPLYSNSHGNVDYDVNEPRINLKSPAVPYHYRNHIKYRQHHKYSRNPHIGTKYHSYVHTPSHNVYTHSPKRSPTSMLEDPYRQQQQPVYANLYWRKIVYPYPQYSEQNNENLMFLSNSPANPMTEESRVVSRRYMSPYKKYYRHRNRYSAKPGNRRYQMKAFYPVPAYTVWRRNYLSRLKPNSVHFTSPARYKRKRRVRPIHPVHNQNNSIQSK